MVKLQQVVDSEVLEETLVVVVDQVVQVVVKLEIEVVKEQEMILQHLPLKENLEVRLWEIP